MVYKTLKCTAKACHDVGSCNFEYKRFWGLESDFSRWAIFSTPPGYSSTNNPIESFNSIIKKFFINRIKNNLLVSLKNFYDVFETYYHKDFCKSVKIPNIIVQRARELILTRNRNLVGKNNNYKYTNQNRKVYNIIINQDASTFNCNCPFFIDKAYCKHLTMVLIKENLSIHGLNFSQKFRIRKKQRNAQKK